MNGPKSVIIGIPTGLGIFIILIFILIIPYLETPNYRLDIDAVKVNDLVQISNVRISNTGKLPLTELTADMGGGDIQFIKKLDPGKTIWLSPKTQKLVSVTVTSKEGVKATKDFRQPSSMVAFGPA